MNRNQLKYFVAAAESRSFTKAAEQFYISQTAITQLSLYTHQTYKYKQVDKNEPDLSL